MWAGRAKYSELPIFGTGGTPRIVATAGSLEHFEVTPLEDHTKQRSVLRFRQLDTSIVGHLLYSAVVVVGRTLRSKR